MPTLLDILEIMCARGFLRQVTRLCVASKELGEVAPMGTARQIYDASRGGHAAALETYLAYWEGNNDIRVLFEADGVSRPTCLQIAVRKNRLSCVKLLVGAGPIVGNVDYCNDSYDKAALHLACKMGFAPIVRFLTSVPAIDINARSRHSGFSPLLLAVKAGHVEVVKILLGLKGLNFGRDGERALKLAKKEGHREILAILTEAKKRQRALDAAGMEVFEAARDGNMADLQRLTEKWSGNADILNWVQPSDEDGIEGNSLDGMTPILAAAFHGRTEAVQMLLSTPEVDPHLASAGFDGENICICAALSGSISCVRLVLSSVPSINVNHQNSFGDSPLMVACRRGDIDIVRELVRVSGVEINHTGWYRGESALAVAIRNRNTEAVRILVNEAHLLDVNHKGTQSINKGLTAMDLLDYPDLGDLDGEGAVIAAILRAAGAKTTAELKAEQEAVAEAM